MKLWYNGYQFAHDTQKVYNPHSMLLYLSRGELLNYWFDTGTPTFLMEIMKQQQYPLFHIEGSVMNVADTRAEDMHTMKLIPLLWQTGYLTIKSFDPQTRNYTLGFPNEEVKVSFLNYVVSDLTQTDVATYASTIFLLTQSLKQENLNLFFDTLKTFFAQIPYTMQLPLEKYYQSIVYAMLNLLGTQIQAEVTTNDGRIDAVIETDNVIYIIEFKLDTSAEEVLIATKAYYQPYAQSHKKTLLVGVSFDTKKRTVAEWLQKELV